MSLRYIPESTKKLLRTEAGFGCCICGNPIFQYQHIIPFSEVKHLPIDERHNTDHMMLLCVEHHYKATHGVIPIEAQYKYKKQPCNIKNGYVRGLLESQIATPIIDAGQTQIIGDDISFSIDNKLMLGLKYYDSKAYISISSYDKKGRKVVQIANNEWLTGSDGRWDIKASYQKLRIKEQIGDKATILDLDMTISPYKLSGALRNRKYKVVLNKNCFEFSKVSSSEYHMRVEDLCLVAPNVNFNSKSKKVDVRSYYSDEEGFSLIKGATSEERIKKGLSVLENIRKNGSSGL